MWSKSGAKVEIDHIALNVEDLEGLQAFYQRYFGAQAADRYHNTKTGLESCFLSFSGGAQLELMHWEGRPAAPRPIAALGYLHICFRLGSREAVDIKTGELIAAGCPLQSGPRLTGDGLYESCLLDPEGNPIELVA